MATMSATGTMPARTKSVVEKLESVGAELGGLDAPAPMTSDEPPRIMAFGDGGGAAACAVADACDPLW